MRTNYSAAGGADLLDDGLHVVIVVDLVDVRGAFGLHQRRDALLLGIATDDTAATILVGS